MCYVAGKYHTEVYRDDTYIKMTYIYIYMTIGDYLDRV